MTDKILCPFCQQELHSASINGDWLECWNCSYNEPNEHKLPQKIFMGTKELWQALIDTKKKLDIAMNLLKIMNDGLPNGNSWKWKIEKALEQINKKEQQ